MLTTIAAPQPRTTTTQAGTVAQRALVAPPDDYMPLTPEGLLIFCQSRLKKLDTAIAEKMHDQNNLVALQGQVGSILSNLKTGGANGGNDTAFDDPAKVKEVSGQLDAAIDVAEKTGNNAAAQILRNVQNKLHAGGDDKVGVDELKEMSSMLDNASSECRSGAEVSMIALQSLVSQRSTALQLTTGMMSSINEGTKAIAANIGR